MPRADQHSLTMPREGAMCKWTTDGIEAPHFLCSACCPSPLTPDLLSPEFIRIHFCFALAAKNLPRAEDPEKCWV